MGFQVQLYLCITIGSIYLLQMISAATYTAAVVTYNPEFDPSVSSVEGANAIKAKNLVAYESLLQQAHFQNSGVDIIVFPEYGLTGLVPNNNFVSNNAEVIPDVEQNMPVKPCNNTQFSESLSLQKLSCLAITYNIVIVANLIEGRDGNTFNTNIVLDENGYLIAKYFKQHIYGPENSILTCPIGNGIMENQEVTFTTSFGVEFGTFTCLDILYCNPALSLVRRGVKHFVFPTFWGNRFPHFVSVNVRQGWTWRNRVSILSSGIENNQHNYFSSGSGVYSSGHPLVYHISGGQYNARSGRVFVAEVPHEPSEARGVPNGERLDLDQLVFAGSNILFSNTSPNNKALSLNPTPGIRFQVTVSVVVDSMLIPTDILGNTFTCKAEYEFGQVNASSRYMLAASVFGPASGTLYYALCSLVKCGIEGCGNPLQGTGYAVTETFTYIKIEGSFSQGLTVIPTVLGNELKLLDTALFTLEDDSIESSFDSEQGILAINLWAKVYDNQEDGFCRSKISDSENSGTNILVKSSIFLMYFLILLQTVV